MSEELTNPFIANRVPPALLALFRKPADAAITNIEPSDAVYYAVRAFDQLPNDPFSTTGLTEPYSTLAGPTLMYALSPDKKAADWHSMETELTFLITLGFAFVRDGKYYIHPLAEVLYGYVRAPTNTTAAEDLMKVMLHYVLPGLYWRTHYARQELPDTIELTHRLDATLRDIVALASSGDDKTA